MNYYCKYQGPSEQCSYTCRNYDSCVGAYSDSNCNTYIGGCEGFDVADYCKCGTIVDEPASTLNTCEQQGYTCSPKNALYTDNPVGSCNSINMNWVGNYNLDIACDGSISFCCKSTKINGACNSTTTSKTFSTKPTSNLCSSGKAGVVNYDGGDMVWYWRCEGSNGGTTAYCEAKYGERTKQLDLEILNPKEGIVEVFIGEIYLEVKTTENAECSYALYEKVLGGLKLMDETGGKFHTQLISGLRDRGDYILVVECFNKVETVKKQVSFVVKIPEYIGYIGVITESQIYEENEEIKLIS